MDFMTREVFDTLIIIVIVIGMALAAVRLYRDFTRPLTGEYDERFDETAWSEDDTRPNAAVSDAAADDESGQDGDR
jgi:hypothetical protein